MTKFITEDWLREHHSLSQGTELQLDADCRLTPAARTLISDRQIQIKYRDKQGRLFLESSQAKNMAGNHEPERVRVHGLTSQHSHDVAKCQLCHQPVTKKTEVMTHLDANTFVMKSDPRLAFRAKLDSTIAQAVWLQVDLPEEVQVWLADIRSVLGNIMRADVLKEPLIDFAIAGLNEKMIHALSHHPLKYLGYDHIVPAKEHGRTVCLLNLLRTQIRETEIAAAVIYIQPDQTVSRPDLLKGLNRLSSAVYVLMLLCLLYESGNPWLTSEMLTEKLKGQL